MRNHARPWKDSGLDRGGDDPYTIAADRRDEDPRRCVRRAAGARRPLVDVGARPTDGETVAAASIAVAEAKAAATEARCSSQQADRARRARSATLAEHGLDRFWRNARTHTVHDPVRWKYRAVGDYWLNGINPPRHGAI